MVVVVVVRREGDGGREGTLSLYFVKGGTFVLGGYLGV